MVNNNNNNISRVSFLQWLIGFIDAEGNFQVQTKKLKNNNIRTKCAFHIGLSLRDKNLIHEIKDYLNMGNIYEYEHRNEAHFAVTKREDLKKLVNMFDTYGFFTKHQAHRYLLFKHCLKNHHLVYNSIDDFNSFIEQQSKENLNNCPFFQFNFFEHSAFFIKNNNFLTNKTTDFDSNVDYIFKNWMSGFITGEGCFNISQNGKVFVFHLEQQEREVLDFMRHYFSFGPKVFVVKQRPGRKQTYAIGISSKKDITRLISFFRDKSDYFVGLKGYKKNQFLYWQNLFNEKHSL